MNPTTKSKRIGSKSIVSPLAGTDGQLMVMAAHRYCLGRRSYIVGSCIDWLRAYWADFEPNTRNVIVRDTLEALMDGCAGDACDKAGWEGFAAWAWSNLAPEGRAWVSGALSHKYAELPDFCRVDQATLEYMSKIHSEEVQP